MKEKRLIELKEFTQLANKLTFTLLTWRYVVCVNQNNSASPTETELVHHQATTS